MLTSSRLEEFQKSIRSVPDFPKKGILFRDITPLLNDAQMLRDCIDHFAANVTGPIDTVVSVESRGFILGSALAYALQAGFVPIRKQGKLPHQTLSASYDLEYGNAVIEIHQDSIAEGSRVILIDDVLATGGTIEASCALAEKLGARIQGLYFLIELADLGGRARLKNCSYPIHSLIRY